MRQKKPHIISLFPHMEHENEGGGDEEKFDWKYWRRFEAINQERKRKCEALMAIRTPNLEKLGNEDLAEVP